jgi:hypothetical protein
MKFVDFLKADFAAYLRNWSSSPALWGAIHVGLLVWMVLLVRSAQQ